jgi:hypothetical protein
MGIKFNTELRRTISPPKLTYLFPQESSLFLNCFNKSSQVEIFQRFAPTGNPKKNKIDFSFATIHKIPSHLHKYGGNTYACQSPFAKINFQTRYHHKPSQQSLPHPKIINRSFAYTQSIVCNVTSLDLIHHQTITPLAIIKNKNGAK